VGELIFIRNNMLLNTEITELALHHKPKGKGDHSKDCYDVETGFRLIHGRQKKMISGSSWD
jgi:hypothetical protein